LARRKASRWSGARLRELRTRAGYTQAELAEAVDVYQYEVSNYERDKTEPTFSVLVRLAEVLSVSLDEFVSPPSGDVTPR
jgi:transcriptional regulator with XRE-family HTH domain